MAIKYSTINTFSIGLGTDFSVQRNDNNKNAYSTRYTIYFSHCDREWMEIFRVHFISICLKTGQASGLDT